MCFWSSSDAFQNTGMLLRPIRLSSQNSPSMSIRSEIQALTPSIFSLMFASTNARSIGSANRPPQCLSMGDCLAIFLMLTLPCFSYAAMAMCSAPCHLAVCLRNALSAITKRPKIAMAKTSGTRRVSSVDVVSLQMVMYASSTKMLAYLGSLATWVSMRSTFGIGSLGCWERNRWRAVRLLVAWCMV